MTINEYLKNHDANEGAEEEMTETRCPICGSDECEVYALRDHKIVGCDCCLCRVLTGEIEWLHEIGCPECSTENVFELYLRHENGRITEIVGCDRCIREVERWRWEAKV